MSTGDRAEINVTPLIDVLLVLLIIFLIITPQKSAGLPAQVPEPAPQSASAEPPREIVIHVAENRELTVNTRPVAWENLADQLRELFVRRPEGVLFVAADRKTEFEDVARVIDIARGAGIAKVALMPRSDRVH